MSFRLLSASMLAALLLLPTLSARAGITAAFDFESQPLSATSLTTLSMSNSGLSVEIDRVGAPFDIVDLTSIGVGTSFGSRSISPNPSAITFVNVNFSQPLMSFSEDMGDFSAANLSDHLALTAFSGVNGTGANLGSSTAVLTLPGNNAFAAKTLSISAPGIRSVQFIGGDSVNPSSVYYDNFKANFASAVGNDPSDPGKGGVSAVPLPSAVWMSPLAALTAWLGARRLRRASVNSV